MQYTTKQLADFRLLSVEILLFDLLTVVKFCWKCNLAMFRLRNEIVCYLEMKYEKLQWIRTPTRINITPHKSRRTKRNHNHFRDGLPFHSLQVQIIPSAALNLRMLLVMWQVNSHNPLSGHCILNPEGGEQEVNSHTQSRPQKYI